MGGASCTQPRDVCAHSAISDRLLPSPTGSDKNRSYTAALNTRKRALAPHSAFSTLQTVFSHACDCIFNSNATHQSNKKFTSDETASDYGSCSPPSCDELLYTPPKLHRRINTNFSNVKMNDAAPRKDRYNFSRQMRDGYFYQVKCRCGGLGGCEGCNNGSGWLVKRIKKGGFALNDDFDVGVPIWSMDYLDNLIAVGCANGQIEFWEGTTGKLKVKQNKKQCCVGV